MYDPFFLNFELSGTLRLLQHEAKNQPDRDESFGHCLLSFVYRCARDYETFLIFNEFFAHAFFSRCRPWAPDARTALSRPGCLMTSA